MKLVTVIAPTTEPVTLDVARAFCRVDHSASDAMIASLIKAGRERCEKVAKRALVPQTLRLSLESWPAGGVIELPRPPLISVTTLQYVDAATEVLTTIASTEYEIDTDSEPGTIWTESVPSYLAGPRAIRVTYLAGYVLRDSAGVVLLADGVPIPNVPEEIKQRILNYVAYCFVRPVERDEVFLDTLFQGFDCGTVA